MAKKFKTVEKNAKNVPTQDKDIIWDGEEITAQSDTKIEQDLGTGRAITIRVFEFGANPEAFKNHKPTAQELFNNHWRGIDALLWRDGLKPFEESQPRLVFAKSKKSYRFYIPCVTRAGAVNVGEHKTLTQLLNPNTTQ